MGVLKIWHMNPDVVDSQGMLQHVQALLGQDSDPQVLGNCVTLLMQVQGVKRLSGNKLLVYTLINRIKVGRLVGRGSWLVVGWLGGWCLVGWRGCKLMYRVAGSGCCAICHTQAAAVSVVSPWLCLCGSSELMYVSHMLLLLLLGVLCMLSMSTGVE